MLDDVETQLEYPAGVEFGNGITPQCGDEIPVRRAHPYSKRMRAHGARKCAPDSGACGNATEPHAGLDALLRYADGFPNPHWYLGHCPFRAKKIRAGCLGPFVAGASARSSGLSRVDFRAGSLAASA